jgi:hypothetical protein
VLALGIYLSFTSLYSGVGASNLLTAHEFSNTTKLRRRKAVFLLIGLIFPGAQKLTNGSVTL